MEMSSGGQNGLFCKETSCLNLTTNIAVVITMNPIHMPASDTKRYRRVKELLYHVKDALHIKHSHPDLIIFCDVGY